MTSTPSDHNRVWTVGSNRYRSSDAELLETGLLADAEVHCVKTKRVWKVHKIILCSRSVWFKKAFTGQTWKEGQTGTVEFSETPENHIDLVLTFLYTGELDFKKFFGEQHRWISCMEVWKLADFLCLDDLKEVSVKAHNFEALHWAREYAMRVLKTRTPEFPSKMLESIVQSISALYRDERDDAEFKGAFKPRFLCIAIYGIGLLSSNNEFRSLVRDTPDLAVDWSLEMMSSINHKTSWDTSTACKCGVRKGLIYPNIINWKKTGLCNSICEECFLKLALEKNKEA